MAKDGGGQLGAGSKERNVGRWSEVAKSGRPGLGETELIHPLCDDSTIHHRANQHPANILKMFLRATLSMKYEFVDDHRLGRGKPCFTGAQRQALATRQFPAG